MMTLLKKCFTVSSEDLCWFDVTFGWAAAAENVAAAVVGVVAAAAAVDVVAAAVVVVVAAAVVAVVVVAVAAVVVVSFWQETKFSWAAWWGCLTAVTGEATLRSRVTTSPWCDAGQCRDSLSCNWNERFQLPKASLVTEHLKILISLLLAKTISNAS